MLQNVILSVWVQDALFTPQKGRSAPNSMEEARAEGGKATTVETLKGAAAAFPPKRVRSTNIVALPCTAHCPLLKTHFVRAASTQGSIRLSPDTCQTVCHRC